jgi:heme A synthase
MATSKFVIIAIVGATIGRPQYRLPFLREAFMQLLELMGTVLVFVFLLLIDLPKIKATANAKKYLAVYYSIIAVGILVGGLEIFRLIPDYDKSLIIFYQKLTGAK